MHLTKYKFAKKQDNSSGIIYNNDKERNSPHTHVMSLVLNQTQPRPASFFKTIFNRTSGKFPKTKTVHFLGEPGVF